MLKTILTVIVIAAIFIWFCYSLWHDGYNDGMLKERRAKIRSWTYYNAAIRDLQTEHALLRADLNDIKRKLAAEKPLTFTHERTSDPIGKVVNTEVDGDGLRFRIKPETDEYMSTDFGEEDTPVIAESLTPVQKEALDSLCN